MIFKKEIFISYEIWTIFHPDLVFQSRFRLFFLLQFFLVWGMEAHPLNFNEMNSIPIPMNEMCNKQCDREEDRKVEDIFEALSLRRTLLLGEFHGHDKNFIFSLRFYSSFFLKPYLATPLCFFVVFVIWWPTIAWSVAFTTKASHQSTLVSLSEKNLTLNTY